MSHTIGQVKQDNPQLNEKVSQDSQQTEQLASNHNSLLSDGDYEFLFNQLLEGIAHGWHDQRITKFFNQLGDRGKPEDWIAWLERLRIKVLTLPTQSRRQLGTMMIRLGELTQSAAQVKEIGTTSNRIGRELLFGNTEDVLWEYVGPDLIDEQLEIETEDEISNRLPKDFTELGSTAIVEELNSLVHDPTEAEKLAVTDISEDLSSVAADPVDSNISEDLSSDSVDSNISDPEKSQNNVEDKQIEDDKTVVQAETSETEILGNAKNTVANSANNDLLTHDLLSPVDSQLEETSEAVNVKQLMNLIQADQELAQQISQKYNISLNSLVIDNDQSIALEDSTSSNLELIESWFNLGLKQVSAGEFAKAIASWEKALKIDPHLAEAWHNRGSALGRLGKYNKAVESFQNALKIDPNNYQAWNDHAHALYQLENWSEAISSWGNAIKLLPTNHLFWYNRGCGLEQLENWTEALISYEKSLEIKPDFQPARSRYINLVADDSRSN